MSRVEVNVSDIKRILLNKRRLKRAADKLVGIIHRHIDNGVDANGLPFHKLDWPRPDGSTENPLLSTGKHLRKSIHPIVGQGEFGVGTKFIGARVHQRGTTGKGGTLPTIRAKRSKFLKFKIHDGTAKGAFMLAHKVDIYPRPYFSISKSELKEVLREYTK